MTTEEGWTMATAQPARAGLKGAAVAGKAGDASTAGATSGSDEERSESPDPRRRGLSRSSHRTGPNTDHRRRV
ncbi:hypothetical protein [Halobellus salinisoli]|uniref:hypothetical protein n=1 Tax=Halobellus salinisoli TaxID=3108500 RepID=UPI00300B5A8A